MKNLPLTLSSLLLCTCLSVTSCSQKRPRLAHDITPGNRIEKELDWQYGANDMKIQTTKLSKILMDRWYEKTGFIWSAGNKPRVIVTTIDNATDNYIPTDMLRDIFESVAANDGRFTVVVGNPKDEKQLDQFLQKYTHDPKYNPSTKPASNKALAPQFIAKIRLTKAITSQLKYDIEDWRMTITLYDLQTQEIIDSAYDVLRKKVFK